MLCTTYATAEPLSLCSEEDAVLYIGETDAPNVTAMFTNLGSQHRALVNVTRDGDEVSVTPFPDIAPGKYLIQLVHSLLVPVEFTPYTQTGYSIAIGADSYFGVYVEIGKVYDVDGGTYIGPDQWVVIG